MSIDLKQLESLTGMNDELRAKRDEIMQRIKDEDLPVMLLFVDMPEGVTSFSAARGNEIEQMILTGLVTISYLMDKKCGTQTPDEARLLNSLMYLITMTTENMSAKDKQTVIESLQEAFNIASASKSQHIHVSETTH